MIFNLVIVKSKCMWITCVHPKLQACRAERIVKMSWTMQLILRSKKKTQNNKLLLLVHLKSFNQHAAILRGSLQLQKDSISKYNVEIIVK